ncbi:MAG: hypothetical protein LBE13_08400 [Bacteroidales bacterium]|jgi:hypothetical protein|nr:hypothetical protein [Bacteroidales bacterium]
MEKTREIIEDFARAINRKKHMGLAPTKGVINFRDERISGIERPIYHVPLELLRYRKDNGRIASDVLSYERSSNKKLDETDVKTQEILFEFLRRKDPEKTEILKKAIKKDGQSEPAIITCDGFLLNGNRRKMVLELLNKEEPGRFNDMKVIILPGKDDDGGPPTIQEIELLENRYQLQQEGKSEYFGLDRALSIKRKISNGVTLDIQLMDDPECAGLKTNDKEFKNKKNKWEKDFLRPLEQVDAYLESLGRPEHYESIKDRWQSFIDWSNFYNGDLQKQNWRTKIDLDEDDIGLVQDIAFKIIRKQHIKSRSEKLHIIIRKLPKFLSNPDAKESICLLSNKTTDLTQNEKYDDERKEYPLVEQDGLWGGKNESIFAQAVNKAYAHLETQEENENSMALIRAALNKVNHNNMDVKNILFDDLKEFMKIAEQIIKDVSHLKNEAYLRRKAK